MQSETFDKNIKNISESFEKIYNEAYHAEQYGLMKICGVGYRKALEFLIKDYAKYKNPEKKEEIENNFLGPCINVYLQNQNIKAMAKRAAWLGNDETHYIRKRKTSIKDLKELIKITIVLIQTEQKKEEIQPI